VPIDPVAMIAPPQAAGKKVGQKKRVADQPVPREPGEHHHD